MRVVGPFGHQDEGERRCEGGGGDDAPHVEPEVLRERDEDGDDDRRGDGVARKEEVEAGDGQHDHERSEDVRHDRDLTEQHPGEPARGPGF